MPKPKVIIQIYPMLPAEDREDRERKRPLGRDRELYSEVLHDWLDVVKAADELGCWGISTIEHHLHSEGYEVGPDPGVLNAWWAPHVKNARLGALGYVMAANDPIRVAEECAILDHITKGKFFCGVARGYQSRWANILGQGNDAVAAVARHIGEKDDVRNREIFEERMEMLIKCWTEDSVELDGRFYQAPYPLEEGIEYPAWKSARDAGAPGEIGEDGRVRRVSVVPKPYQDPYPPIFQAVSASPDSIRFAARNGFRPTYFTKLEKMEEFSHLYVEEGRKAGHDFVLGERQNMCRWIHVADTEREYDEKLEAYDRDIYENFYVPFFPQFPDDTSSIDWVENIKASGIFHGGTLEQLTEQFVHAYETVPAEFITLIWHYAQVPKDEVIHELDVFMSKVLPELEVPEPTGAEVSVGGMT
jgi:alkanesulfonate monooxygenase SsuD/methylene tetrahydromethanopterin reductase-like flavin-dependent oxidoreductase (luciferase family)